VDSPVQQYFPDKKWGYLIPSVAGILLVSMALIAAGVACIKDGQKKEE